MRGISGWNYRPYRPATHQLETRLPFICRLAPTETEIGLQWFDAGSECAHTLRFRPMDSTQAWQTLPLTDDNDGTATIRGLSADRDYELQIMRNTPDAGASAVRYARTGNVPGSIINYLHPRDELYAFSGRALCSPSIVKLPSGAILASMDLFAPGAPQNLVLLFRSDDDGQTWRYVCDLFPCYWATLFMHRGRLYLQSCSTEYGDILIGVSDDEGYTWSKPERLFVGSSSPLEEGWQRTPMPILRANGRLYISVDYGAWKTGGHAIGMLSIGEYEDLLASENWRVSGLIAYDPDWPGAPKGNSSGLLEGNMLVGRDGRLLDLLRIGLIGCEPSHGVAVLLQADPSDVEKPLEFHRFINMPSGSNSKSHVIYDEVSGLYIAIGNICVNASTPGQRNVLALEVSEDVYSWRTVKVLLDYRDTDPGKVGFQYISFAIDGDDIIYQSRTSLNGARNFHDANYMTFHRIPDFRRLIAEAANA